MVTTIEATDLTEQEAVAEVESAAQLERRIHLAIADGRRAAWKLAEALYSFDEIHGWLKLGYESKSHWLAQPDITMTNRTYRSLVRVWRELAVYRGVDCPTISALDYSKVTVVLDSVTKGTALLGDALEDAASLSQRALKEKYRAGDPAKHDDAESRRTEAHATPSDVDGHAVELEAEPTAGQTLTIETGDRLTRLEVENALREIQAALDSGQREPRFPRATVAVMLILGEGTSWHQC